jgi:hypothetical protein
MQQRVEQTPSPLTIFIHKSQKFTIIDGLTQLWRMGKCLKGAAVGRQIGLFTWSEKKLCSPFKKRPERFSRMIFNVIEPTARTTGFVIIRLTEVKRILSHTFLLSLQVPARTGGR